MLDNDEIVVFNIDAYKISVEVSPTIIPSGRLAALGSRGGTAAKRWWAWSPGWYNGGTVLCYRKTYID